MSVETRSFQTEVNQLLKLMIHSLYSNREIFLRELISNASDALDKRRFAGLTNEVMIAGQGNAEILISFDKEAKTLTINDNGIGMNRQEVIDNIGTIAKSGTKAFLEQLTQDQKNAAQLIGQFGVGFYSAFIVADKIVLTTRKAGEAEDTATRWVSSGEAEFTLETTQKAQVGTEIVLHLRQEHEDLLTEWALRSIIKKYSDHIAYPVMMQIEREVPRHDEETSEDQNQALETETVIEQVNDATSLWQRAKKDISDEEYIEFYKHVAHDYQAPLAWTHNRVEGKTDYTALLYLPQKAPMGMWEQNATHGVQLYVQRVFIMDGADKLMPRYLRFVKGVIDAQDLPLNVSREILQSSQVIDHIRQGAIKRVLSLLDNLSVNEAEKYQQFWQEFGRVLKEGLGEDFANRDALLKLMRFSSTTSDTATVSLANYLERLVEGQDKIYYLTADSLNTAKSSPHLEIFKKKGIEVLLMSEPVDDWMMGFVHEFEGKSFVHIAKGDIQFPDDNKEEAEKTLSDDEKSLIDKIKPVLIDKVADVKISQRLTDSAACLVRGSHAMSGHFERLLKEAGHDVPSSKPWLEINPEHPLLNKIAAQNNEDLIWLLYEQALLLEGGAIEDPATFVARMNRLMN